MNQKSKISFTILGLIVIAVLGMYGLNIGIHPKTDASSYELGSNESIELGKRQEQTLLNEMKKTPKDDPRYKSLEETLKKSRELTSREIKLQSSSQDK